MLPAERKSVGKKSHHENKTRCPTRENKATCTTCEKGVKSTGVKFM